MSSFSEIEFNKFINFMYDKHHYNFQNYSKDSLKRRLVFCLDRMNLMNLDHLQDQMTFDPTIARQVVQFITVNTTEMFRDPQFFQAFRHKVVPVLKTYPYPKIWIAGCSTGEEVLSYCIILHEEGLLDRTMIYATDINQQALKTAKNRIYDLDRMKLYSNNYLRSGGHYSLVKYYSVYGNFAIFSKKLLKAVTFADHCLATDFSFSEFQYISCRNVLIYFDRTLQNRVLSLFLASLVDLGFLGIGAMEDIKFTKIEDQFEEWQIPNIFRKIPKSKTEVDKQ